MRGNNSLFLALAFLVAGGTSGCKTDLLPSSLRHGLEPVPRPVDGVVNLDPQEVYQRIDQFNDIADAVNETWVSFFSSSPQGQALFLNKTEEAKLQSHIKGPSLKDSRGIAFINEGIYVQDELDDIGEAIHVSFHELGHLNLDRKYRSVKKHFSEGMSIFTAYALSFELFNINEIYGAKALDSIVGDNKIRIEDISTFGPRSEHDKGLILTLELIKRNAGDIKEAFHELTRSSSEALLAIYQESVKEYSEDKDVILPTPKQMIRASGKYQRLWAEAASEMWNHFRIIHPKRKADTLGEFLIYNFKLREQLAAFDFGQVVHGNVNVFDLMDRISETYQTMLNDKLWSGEDTINGVSLGLAYLIDMADQIKQGDFLTPFTQTPNYNTADKYKGNNELEFYKNVAKLLKEGVGLIAERRKPDLFSDFDRNELDNFVNITNEVADLFPYLILSRRYLTKDDREGSVGFYVSAKLVTTSAEYLIAELANRVESSNLEGYHRGKIPGMREFESLQGYARRVANYNRNRHSDAIQPEGIVCTGHEQGLRSVIRKIDEMFEK
jgi:hypothetical protein